MLFFDEGVPQQAVAEIVDEPRHAARLAVNEREAVLGNGGIAVPAGCRQPEQDVFAGFDVVEGRQVVDGDDALAELLEALARQLAAEFRLADEEHLQQRASLMIDVREHAQLLQRRHRKALGLVDDENGPRSEEHTSELQSLMRSSYAVFCLKKK